MCYNKHNMKGRASIPFNIACVPVPEHGQHKFKQEG